MARNRKSVKNRRNGVRANSGVEQLEAREMFSATPLVTHTAATPVAHYPIVAPVSPVKGRSLTLTSQSTISGSPVGLLPNQVRTAYGVDQISFGGLKGDGAGQTIAIIDWGDDPFMVNSTSKLFAASDLHQFDVATGLPDPPSFQKVDQNGGTNYPSGSQNSGVEISLDVEWSHAMAPAANIILVEASDNAYSTLFGKAVNYARNNKNVSLISMSFGGAEFGQETALDSDLTTPAGHQGITFLASSGDDGNELEYPSTSPNVLSVGGTGLQLNPDNTYLSESGWNGSGGGISLVEAQPSYQKSYAPLFTTARRATPDVAFLADPSTGVAVLDSVDYGGWSTDVWGGTSLASPMMAGVLAVANEGRVLAGKATLNGVKDTLPDIYKLSQSNPGDFHDITTGNNGYPAHTGYDFVTGVGSPVVKQLTSDLIGDTAPVIKSLSAKPGSETVGTNFTLTAQGVSDADGGGVTVSFYRESNNLPGLQTTGTPDVLLGTSSSGFSQPVSTSNLSAGTYTYYAVVTDKLGLSGQTVSASNIVTSKPVNSPPVISSLSSNPSTEIIGSPFSLVTIGASEVNGTIANVTFYRESNGVSGLQTTGANPDTNLGQGAGSNGTYSDAVQTGGLSAGSYTYYAIATDTKGVSSNPVSTTNNVTRPVPIAPTNLRTTSINSNSVGLAFDANNTPDVVYRIAMSTDGVNWNNIAVISGTTYTATGLTQGSTVYFEVRAAAGELYSAYSNVLSVNLPSQTPPAPNNLRVTSADTTSVALAFDAPVTPGIVYRIAMSNDGANWNHSGDTSGTTYTATGLNSGATYYFEVRAANGTVYSDYSNVVSATLPVLPPVIQPPAAPTNLVAARDDATSALDVLLTWNNPGGVVSGINIARSTDGVNFDHLATIAPGSTSYLDSTGLTKGKTYYYEIRSFVIINGQTYYSAYSNIDAAIPR